MCRGRGRITRTPKLFPLPKGRRLSLQTPDSEHFRPCGRLVSVATTRGAEAATGDTRKGVGGAVSLELSSRTLQH